MTPEQLTEAFPQKHEKWRRHGYKVNVTELIKTIIMATKKLHWPLTDNRGCREVWYNPVKPILYKAEQDRVDKHECMKRFENILAIMVKNGELTYADLGINDFRTLRDLYENIDRAECWKNILLFVEKDSAYVHLRPLQNLFNITIMSGGGWSHAAGIERMLRDITEKGITEVVVFTLTDYDPFGFAIEKEFTDKCEILGLRVKEYHRVGIKVGQATPEILKVQKYPIKKGRILTVNEVSFNSDEWLAEYGIDGKYGLEIEAISAQQGGHQFLREIVTTELLKYMKETDRIEELTAKGWQEVPLHAIGNFMNSTYNSRPEEKEITTLPTDLPEEFLSYKEYSERTSDIEAEKETATEDIDGEISDLEDQLRDLETKKEDIEQPFDSRLDDLTFDYECSARLVMHALYRYWNENRDKWPREKYSLGYPEGCILEGIKQQANIYGFIEHLDLHEVHDDLINAFTEIMKNGEFTNVLKRVWEDVQRNNGHDDTDSEGEEQ
jgi:hypothetical protein